MAHEPMAEISTAATSMSTAVLVFSSMIIGGGIAQDMLHYACIPVQSGSNGNLLFQMGDG